MAAKIRKGDTVMVMAGKSKGMIGVVLAIVDSGARLLVEGANMVKKHVKPNPQLQQEGGIITKEAPIHHSNVMIIGPDKKPSRVNFKFVELNGRLKKVRCFATTGEAIDAVSN